MTFKIDIIQNDDALINLKPLWQELINKAKVKSPFLTYEWIYQWWKSYREQLNKARLSIITLWDHQHLIAILPLFKYQRKISKNVSFTYLQMMGTEFESSDYLDIICDSESKETYLQALFTSPQIQNLLKKVDVLDFSNITDASALRKMKDSLGNLLNATVYSYRIKTCPYIDLPREFDAFWNHLSRNLRSNLRRTQNKFKKQGFTMEVVQSKEEIKEAIRRLFELHQMRFQSKQAQTKFRFEQRGIFHQQIAKKFLEKGWLQLYRVKDGHTVIGALYCFKFGNSMMYLQGGFDPHYQKFALGNLVILQAISDAIEMGLQKFDFMRGNEAYKYRWATGKVFLNRITFPLSFKARVYYFYQDMLFQTKQMVKAVIKRDDEI